MTSTCGVEHAGPAVSGFVEAVEFNEDNAIHGCASTQTEAIPGFGVVELPEVLLSIKVDRARE